MSQFSESNPYSPPPMSPPSYPGNIPQQPSTWPTVLGVILIILASLGILTNGCGGIFNALMPALTQTGNNADPVMQAQADVTAKYLPYIVVKSVVMVALGILLLIGGIHLVKRRRAGVTLSRTWAVARIVVAFPDAVIGYNLTMDMLSAMEQASQSGTSPMPAGLGGIVSAIGIVGVIIGLIFVCAVPIFVLIWFALPKIKSQTATWT